MAECDRFGTLERDFPVYRERVINLWHAEMGGTEGQQVRLCRTYIRSQLVLGPLAGNLIGVHEDVGMPRVRHRERMCQPFDDAFVVPSDIAERYCEKPIRI